MTLGPASFGDDFLVWQQNHIAIIHRTLQTVLDGGAHGVPKEDISELLKGWAIGKKLVEKRTDKDIMLVGIFRNFDKEFDQLTKLLQACGIDLERFYKMLSEPAMVETCERKQVPATTTQVDLRSYWLHCLISGLLGLAFVDWDEHGFYVLLRFVCCAAFAHWSWLAIGTKHKFWISTWALLTLLYNPFLPLGLGRFVWEWVNGVTLVLVVIDAVGLRNRTKMEMESVANQSRTS